MTSEHVDFQLTMVRSSTPKKTSPFCLVKVLIRGREVHMKTIKLGPMGGGMGARVLVQRYEASLFWSGVVLHCYTHCGTPIGSGNSSMQGMVRFLTLLYFVILQGLLAFSMWMFLSIGKKKSSYQTTLRFNLTSSDDTWFKHIFTWGSTLHVWTGRSLQLKEGCTAKGDAFKYKGEKHWSALWKCDKHWLIMFWTFSKVKGSTFLGRFLPISCLEVRT